jgi:TatD DNase family protein
MIDTHCHLEMTPYDEDRNEVIKRAAEAGLEAVITIGSDFAGCKGAVELSRKHDFIYAAVGIHPHDAKDFSPEIEEQIKSWIAESREEAASCSGNEIPKIVAIGEIGLDYHYDLSPRDVQREVFIRQLEYAAEIDLPVSVHSREANKATMQILQQSGIKKGVLHCFSGDGEMAEAALAMGLHISIAGPVTFKKAEGLKEIARVIPDERLLVETDAPYLAPVPYRGKRNEPAYVVETAKYIAGLRGITYEDIDRMTTLNAKRLFGIGTPDEAKIAYKIRNGLYLNITNRCTSKCSFCIRYQSDFVKGHNLRLQSEPTEKELKSAIGDPSRYSEVVFCGYGEPMLRLDLVKSLSAWIKENGGIVRINTNGHGNLIAKRNVLPELKGIVDVVSVSLDAQDEETYSKICRPSFGNAFSEVVEFMREATKYIPDVQATVVEMDGVDVEKCRELTDSLGIKLRVRKLDVVG